MLNIVSDAVYNIVSAITIGERYMVLFSKIANGFIKIIRFLQENIRFGPLLVSLCLILFYHFVPYKYFKLLFLIHIKPLSILHRKEFQYELNMTD